MKHAIASYYSALDLALHTAGANSGLSFFEQLNAFSFGLNDETLS
jgi:hypothetical protein